VSSTSAVSRDAAALAALRGLLVELRDRNPFYASRLKPLTPPMPANLADFTARFPVTTKQELVADQTAHPPYGTARSEPLARFTRCHQTSGTHGAPLRWLDTPESWQVMTEDWVEVLRQAGVVPSDRMLFAFSFGPFLGFWLAFEAGLKLGSLCIPGGGMSSAQRARVLAENRCTVLCCTPTYALHLARESAAAGISTDSVRLIIVAGEAGGSVPGVRSALERAWPGARIFDHHGMTETGPVTHEDPTHPGRLIVLERSFLAEVIDPATAQPVPEGTEGELVLTTLRRRACPLLRYRTGDLVRAVRVPAGLALEGGILGRLDDMVVVRGVNVYPSAIETLVRQFPEIGEFRVTLDRSGAMTELRLEIEGSESTASALHDRIRSSLALRVPVTPVPPGTLPRFEMKARRWVEKR
jgi:phenylacetate-CoA ligase